LVNQLDLPLAQRSGPFWDAVNGREPRPPAAATLGAEYLDSDPAAGTIKLAFAATEEFTNPSGNVLGGFLAAMLYDTVGPALLASLEPDQFQSTAQLTTSFLRPVRPGRITGIGRVVHRDGDLAYLAAELTDSDGDLVATATAVSRIIAFGSSAP
jgi:uncharacterized protein (TIGR00369 family)